MSVIFKKKWNQANCASEIKKQEIMKTFITSKIKLVATFLVAISTSAFTQKSDTIKIQNGDHTTTILSVSEDGNQTKIVIPSTSIVIKEWNDTVSTITLGNRRFEVIEDDDHTKIRMTRDHIDKFKGHFAGIDLGFNNLMTPSFSTSYPSSDRFMELNPGKSINVGINFLQYSIPLQQHKQNLGLVTGLAFNISNYRFDNDYLLMRDPNSGITTGKPLPIDTLAKSKLVTTYINIPLLFEYQVPTSGHRNKFFIAAGGFVGFKTSSHTKMVYENDHKDKNHNNLNIRPYQWGITARVGYDWIKLFANYNFSSLFMADKGPELYPFTVGITIISL